MTRLALRPALLALLTLLVFPGTGGAQRGMGGMGGMGGGGRGGMGGTGGRGRGGMGEGPRAPSPIAIMKESLKENDPIRFLLDRKKPLALTKAQRDTLSRYRDDMESLIRPVLKDAEHLANGLGREGRDRRRGGPADSLGVLSDRIRMIQDSVRGRARGQLTDAQRATADSLERVSREELLRKMEQAREQRRARRELGGSV